MGYLDNTIKEFQIMERNLAIALDGGDLAFDCDHDDLEEHTEIVDELPGSYSEYNRTYYICKRCGLQTDEDGNIV